MTLCTAWLRKAQGPEELVFATDSCFSGGERWNVAVKLFELPRRDCLICFAGQPTRAYPMIANLIQTIRTDVGLFNRQTDLFDVLRHTKELFTDLVGIISDPPKPEPDDLGAEAAFVFGGWRWQDSSFYVWRLDYNQEQRQFVEEQAYLDDSEPACFVGDDLDKAREMLQNELAQTTGTTNIRLDMEPFRVLAAMSREARFDTIAGPPQVGKVYKSGTSELFGVYWQSIAGGRPCFQGKELSNIYRIPARFIDPDTANVLEELPALRPTLEANTLGDDYGFVQDCYENDLLRGDLTLYSRHKLRRILQEVAYNQFLSDLSKREQESANDREAVKEDE
jgi:hypothetical protein